MRLELQPQQRWITSEADEAETPTALLQLGFMKVLAQGKVLQDPH